MLSIAARCTTRRNSQIAPSSTRTMIPMAIPSTPEIDSPKSLDMSTTIYLMNNLSHTDNHRKLAIIIRACSLIGLPVNTGINQGPNWKKKEPSRTPVGLKTKEKHTSLKGAGLLAENRWITVKAGIESRASGFSEA